MLDRFRDHTDARDGRAFAFVLGAEVGEELISEVAALDGVEEVGGSVTTGPTASFEIDTSIVAPTDDAQFRTI